MKLSPTQRAVLWQLAQYKYGWGYISGVGRRSAARALSRAGLLVIELRDYRCTLTGLGEVEATARWPRSPLALRSYARPDGGWELCGEEAA